MKLKIYSQKHCKYCDDIKTALKKANLEFEELELDENRETWNKITRIVGMGMTPTIQFGKEIWVPGRDFRGPEELIKRIEYYKEFPLEDPTDDEKIEIISNATKNLGMSIQQINRTLGNIQNSLNQILNPKKEEPIIKEETNVKEEITS